MRRTGLFSRARRPRAAGTRRSVRRLCLCLALTLSLCAVTIWARVGPLVRSYGEEMFYHLIVPGWVRWLLEPAPLIVTPREGFEPTTANDGGGALPTGVERWGDHLITRVSATPNVTLVHDFMTSEECAFVRALGRKMGMVSGTRFPVTNGVVDASAAGLYNYVYGLVRTSVGEYVDYKSLDDGDLARMVAIAKKVEAVTGLAVGNSEAPFVQHYEPSARFRAHYGEQKRVSSRLDVGSPMVNFYIFVPHPVARLPTHLLRPLPSTSAQTCTTWTSPSRFRTAITPDRSLSWRTSTTSATAAAARPSSCWRSRDPFESKPRRAPR